MEGGTGRGIPHVAALDGARGLAVAGVLLFHDGHLLGGYLGVDFFFTLSGFLITSLLLAEAGRSGSVGLGGFWARRARRLLPALAVLMVGVALYCVAFADKSQLTQIRDDAFATLAYAANWRAVFAHQNYWALFSKPSPLQHTWSLAIEEQFYVVWPLLFVGLLARFKRNAARAVLITSLVLAAASSVLMIVLYDPFDSNRVYYGTDTRAAAILFGAALAAWLAIHGPVAGRRARIALEGAGLAGAAVLAVAWTRLDGQSSRLYHGGFLVCGLAATAVIAAAVHARPGPLARVLSLKPLCALGLISYGVYLYHWPIDIVVDAKRTGVDGWPLFALQTAVTLAIAVVSYRVVEQPIRRGAFSAVQWRRLTPAIAFALVVALFASTLGARAPVATASDPFAGTDTPTGQLQLLAAHAARVRAPAGAERIMVVGDSVAAFLVAPLKRITSPPLALYSTARGGCVFPPGPTRIRYRLDNGALDIRPAFPCEAAWEAGAEKQFRPHVVLWMISNPWQSVFYNGRWIEPCEEPYNSLYEQSLRDEVSRLGVGGAHVVITTAPYWGGGLRPERQNDCDNALRRKVAGDTGAQLIDLFSFVCPDGRGVRCRTKQNGVNLRPDGLHYTGPGGPIVAKWLIGQIDHPS